MGILTMKAYLRLLLSVLTLPLLPLWLFIPPVCLLIIATEYAWRGKVHWPGQCEVEEKSPMTTVKQQQTKRKNLREHLVAWVNARPGVWTLGAQVVREVLAGLFRQGINTTGEVLAKELRKACRKGEIRKRINDDRMVEYTAIGTGEGALFDFEAPRVHGVAVKARRG